jgi:hypothetical protein
MDDKTFAGIDRLTGLLAWWGMAGAEGKKSMPRQLNRLDTFVSDIQKAWLDAANRQVSASLTANEELALSAQAILRNRTQAEFLASQTEIATTISKAASIYAATWAEFQHRIQDCCTAILQAPAADIAVKAEPANTPPRSGQISAKRATDKLVDA